VSHHDATTADHTAIRREVEARDKQIANLKARAALAGYVLLIVSASDGGSAFMIQKFGLVRELRNVAEVEQFLDRAAGAMR
jgi:hypothetical protein